MSKFIDYINGLEGREDIDPTEVVRNLLNLHNEEIGIRDAKIDELNGSVAEKDTAIATRDIEITQWKAKNFDLAMQIPGAPIEEELPNTIDRVIDGGTITIDDLFDSRK